MVTPRHSRLLCDEVELSFFLQNDVAHLLHRLSNIYRKSLAFQLRLINVYVTFVLETLRPLWKVKLRLRMLGLRTCYSDKKGKPQ